VDKQSRDFCCSAVMIELRVTCEGGE